MKIKLLDKVMENYDLDVDKLYEVIRTEIVRDDLYYIVMNELNDETAVHDLLAREVGELTKEFL